MRTLRSCFSIWLLFLKFSFAIWIRKRRSRTLEQQRPALQDPLNDGRRCKKLVLYSPTVAAFFCKPPPTWRGYLVYRFFVSSSIYLSMHSRYATVTLFKAFTGTRAFTIHMSPTCMFLHPLMYICAATPIQPLIRVLTRGSWKRLRGGTCFGAVRLVRLRLKR